MTVHYKTTADGREWSATAACKGIARINGRTTPRMLVTNETAAVTCKRCLVKFAKTLVFAKTAPDGRSVEEIVATAAAVAKESP